MLYRLLTFSNHQIASHSVQSVVLLATPKTKCKSTDRKQALVQLRCLQWRQHQLEGNWNSLSSSLSLNVQNAIRSACKSEAWVGNVDHHKAQRSAARFVQRTERAVTVCDELHTAGYNKDCCSIVWNTKTSCMFLIGRMSLYLECLLLKTSVLTNTCRAKNMIPPSKGKGKFHPRTGQEAPQGE